MKEIKKSCVVYKGISYKVGDKVKTNYYPEEKDVIRTIVNIEQSKDHKSGYMVSVATGERCEHCGVFSGKIKN